MLLISNFLSAQTPSEKKRAIDSLESNYGSWMSPDFGLKISDAPEWDKSLQQACIDRLRQSRERFSGNSPDFSESYFENLEIETAYELTLTKIVENLSVNPSSAIAQAFLLAQEKDITLKGTGETLLWQFRDDLESSFQEILYTMEKQGAWHSPYTLGQVFNYLVDKNLDLLDSAAVQLQQSKSEKLIGAALSALCEREAIPDRFDAFVLQSIQSQNNSAKSLGLCTIRVKPQLAKVVEDDIFEALSSTEWFVRGNAASACGHAQLSSSRFLPSLIGLLTDFEGHDWTPAENAVSAIAKYGAEAAAARSALEKAIKAWKIEFDGYDDDDFVVSCQQAIAGLEA